MIFLPSILLCRGLSYSYVERGEPKLTPPLSRSLVEPAPARPITAAPATEVAAIAAHAVG